MKYSIYVHSPQKKYPHNQNRHKSFLPVPLRVRGHRKQLNRWKCHALTHSVTFQYFGSGCNRVNQEVPGCKPYVTEVWQGVWLCNKVWIGCKQVVTGCYGGVAWYNGGITWCNGGVTRCNGGVWGCNRGVRGCNGGVTGCNRCLAGCNMGVTRYNRM